MYDWKKTAKKVLIQAVFVFIAGLAAIYGKSPWYLAIVPALNGIANWLKHHNDK